MRSPCARTIVFAAPPALGHIHPVLDGLVQLEERGHKVIPVLADSVQTPRLHAFADVVRYRSAWGDTTALSDTSGSMTALADDAAAALPSLIRVVETAKAPVIVGDVLAFAAAITAQHLQLPYIATWPVFASNEEYSLHRDSPTREEGKGGEDIAGMLRSMEPVVAQFAPGVDVQSVVWTTPANSVCLFPRWVQPRRETFDEERYRFTWPGRPQGLVDRDAVGPLKPVVLVSLGTIFNDDRKFLEQVFQAIERLGWRGVVAGGRRAREYQSLAGSADITVEESLDFQVLMGEVDVAVLHGSLTSAMEALSAGVPLVLSPHTGDQRAVAKRFGELGLARAVDRDCTVEELTAVLATAASGRSPEADAFFRQNGRYGSGAHFAEIIEFAMGCNSKDRLEVGR